MTQYTFKLERDLEKQKKENQDLKDIIARHGNSCCCPKGKTCILMTLMVGVGRKLEGFDFYIK